MLREEILRLLAVVIAGSLGVAAKDVTDDEYSRFPKLFHLDDFETCLMQTGGLYCVGTFRVTPLRHPHPTYELMKEYSSDPFNYNHTLIHRGYCVSARCPSIADRNAARRFERCASKSAQRHGLRASLTELSYCRSRDEDIALQDWGNSVDTPHRVFLYILGIIVALNVIGTVYDVMTKSGSKNEEYSRFPRLFHLDDYDACLSRPGGLYCLGTFRITPAKEPHHMYNMLKEYSQDVHHFNRTELHRGYCISSRCPSIADRNTSLRFEHCASHWARRQALRVRLTRLDYCRTHAQEYARKHTPEPMDVPQKVFLYIVVFLVALNVLGTVYDVVTEDNEKKNSMLTSWSLRSNWRRLTASYEDGDPRLAALTPVQGIRVLLMVLIMATHSGCIHDMLYLYNPRWIEQISRHPVLMLFLNGTSVVQMFVLLSNFLLAYNLLIYSKTNAVTYKMLPIITIKRIARISPVYLLVVGFAATWWVRGGAGPLWPAVVGAEGDACRRKFWTHVFYINNLVDPEDICLIQTWFLAVDMQLYLLASLLSVYLTRRRERALSLLAGLVVLSCVLNGALAYAFDWKSLLYYAYPRNLKTMYRGIPSFSWLYQSPWGSLPPCLIGLFLAFLHYHMQETGIKMASYKWLYPPYQLAPVAMVCWILWGSSLRQHSAPWFVATFAALERPVLSMLGGLLLMGMVNGLEGWLRRLCWWRGWHALGRMSLSVLMLHWCINLALAAARPQPLATSLLSVMVDWIATSWCSYMLAIPLTIMVEMPVLRFVTSLLMAVQAKSKQA